MSSAATKSGDPWAAKYFPRNAFIAALVLTSVLLATLGWVSWNSYQDFRTTETKLHRLEELIGVINTADEFLTMSARMAAVTGDLSWEARYLSLEPELDTAIKEALRILPDRSLSDAIAKTKAASMALFEMDRRSFGLVRDHENNKARDILFSQAYENQRIFYKAGTAEATSYIHRFVEDSLKRQRQRAFISFVSVGIVFSISIAAWVVAFRLTGRYLVQRDQAEEALRKSRKELLDITSSLAEGLYVLDDIGNITFMNPEAERLLGWSQEELRNKTPHNIIHGHSAGGKKLSLEECPIFKVVRTGDKFHSTDEIFIRKDGTAFPVSVLSSPIMDNGKIIASITAFRNITDRKRIESDREKLIEDLQQAMSKVKLLSGFIPICASCKKIRDDKGYWNQIESYIRDHSEAEFSHGICPDCAKKLYPEYAEDMEEKTK
jgi:PAS domain S-box-containing protein